MDEGTQATASGSDLPPWARSLLYVLVDCRAWLDYAQNSRTCAGDDIPTVPELALEMIEPATDMLVWCYPDGVVRQVVHPIRHLLDQLEGAIEEDLNTLIEEVL